MWEWPEGSGLHGHQNLTWQSLSTSRREFRSDNVNTDNTWRGGWGGHLWDNVTTEIRHSAMSHRNTGGVWALYAIPNCRVITGFISLNLTVYNRITEMSLTTQRKAVKAGGTWEWAFKHFDIKSYKFGKNPNLSIHDDCWPMEGALDIKIACYFGRYLGYEFDNEFLWIDT